jgi:4-hydroxythreonine-4-phosphate dehydrogenase
LPVIAVPRKTAAQAAVASIDAAVGAALAGKVGGMVTNPISKARLYEDGFKFPGHTEYIAHLTSRRADGGGARPGDDAGRLWPSLRAGDHPSTAQGGPRASDDRRVVYTATVTAEALKRDFGSKTRASPSPA